jgi:hypothetical protein
LLCSFGNLCVHHHAVSPCGFSLMGFLLDAICTSFDLRRLW